MKGVMGMSSRYGTLTRRRVIFIFSSTYLQDDLTTGNASRGVTPSDVFRKVFCVFFELEARASKLVIG